MEQFKDNYRKEISSKDFFFAKKTWKKKCDNTADIHKIIQFL